MNSIASLEAQLEEERAKVSKYEAKIASMAAPRDPVMYGLWERKRLAAFQCAALLVTKIESLRERMKRDQNTEAGNDIGRDRTTAN